MLNQADNELLCRIGPGTPMGGLIREYWLPAVRSDELSGPDGPPMRLRLLGEDLIAFRNSEGNVGLFENACPHRGASLFFGRNEESGLRCVYHGWKFDVTGRCIDMPSEPAESNFKSKVAVHAYPCEERNGTIWAYMGARSVPPSLPQIEPNIVPSADGRFRITTSLRECNWVQAMEGDIDTSHLQFLHLGKASLDEFTEGSFDYYIMKDRAPRYDVREMEHGTSYGTWREIEGGKVYWRIAHFLFPFYTMIPTSILGRQIMVRAWVPIDDENMMFWMWGGPTPPTSADGAPAPAAAQSRPRPTAGWGSYLPDKSGWQNRWRLTANKDNDYLIDRENQKSRTFTGIPGIHEQDQAVTESMGELMDRSREHLGTSDLMVIRTRRCLLNAVRAHQNRGEVPATVDSPALYAIRSGGTILERGLDWWQGTAEIHQAFTSPDLSFLPPAVFAGRF